MNILLTGGSGDLGRVLSKRLELRGDLPLRLDVRPPSDGRGRHIQASILDREALARAMPGVELVVHIAAWHGFHEAAGLKDAYDFWDLNVTGTFNVFEAARQAGVRRLVNISSTSIFDSDQFYGFTKRLSEQVAADYAARHAMQVLTLRPRAFIPHWNRQVYRNFIEWARWFWGGAVHIDDVSQAVLLAIDLLKESGAVPYHALTVDGAYDYTQNDLDGWDASGPGSTFQRTYPGFYELAVRHGLDPALKPKILEMDETRRLLGYRPAYSLRSLLEELQRYGEVGPPPPPP